MTTFFLAVTFHYKKLTKSGKLFRNVYTLQNPPITCTSYSLRWLFGVTMFLSLGWSGRSAFARFQVEGFDFGGLFVAVREQIQLSVLMGQLLEVGFHS